jgi:hypothetical protein
MIQFGITKKSEMTAAQALEAAVQLLRAQGYAVGETELVDDGVTDLVVLIDVDVDLPFWTAGNGVSLDAEAP